MIDPGLVLLGALVGYALGQVLLFVWLVTDAPCRIWGHKTNQRGYTSNFCPRCAHYIERTNR